MVTKMSVFWGGDPKLFSLPLSYPEPKMLMMIIDDNSAFLRVASLNADFSHHPRLCLDTCLFQFIATAAVELATVVVTGSDVS